MIAGAVSVLRAFQVSGFKAPVAGILWADWNPLRARRKFRPGAPSIWPTEKWARARSIWARTIEWVCGLLMFSGWDNARSRTRGDMPHFIEGRGLKVFLVRTRGLFFHAEAQSSRRTQKSLD